MKEQDLIFLADRLRGHYREIIVDGFIFDPQTQSLLLQKRAPDRKLFPNFWDTLGGHLENDESLANCLKREIFEESGMELKSIVALVHQFEWDSDPSVINLQFVCFAEGTPTPEVGKVTEVRWIREDQLESLGDALTPPMRTGVIKAFAFMRGKLIACP